MSDEWEFEEELRRGRAAGWRARGTSRGPRRRRRVPWVFRGLSPFPPAVDVSVAEPPPAAPPEPAEEPAEDPGDGGEWELVERTIDPPIRLSWTKPLSVSDAAAQPGGGVYIIEKGKKPIYVGEAGRFSARVGVSARKHGGDAVRLGRFAGSAAVSARERVEHAVIRTLKYLGHPLSENFKSVLPFKVVGSVTVHNVVPYPVRGPMFVRRALTLRQGPTGTYFELRID